MDHNSAKLFKELKEAGLSRAAIEAAWPVWWSDDLSESPSARAELRFALARKLGLAPKPLLGERVEFVWRDSAKFKNLSIQNSTQQDILSSFGVSIGRLLLRATPIGRGFDGLSAEAIRGSIIRSTAGYVDLRALLSTSWAVGVPVIQLKVFPLTTKSMHAMVIESGGRHAIILGRDASYPAPVAFTLAHEIGHIVGGHLKGASALVDLEDPALASSYDADESEADAFALSVLTGTPTLTITTELQNYNAPTLARAVLNAAPLYGIEPGTFALCVAYRQKNWAVAMSALKFIYAEAKPVWKEVNGIADSYIDWDALGDEAEDYLRKLMYLEDV
ncbi:ImmA/IrrE family metallo-endopeptidase [Rhodopseudomonas palustris]|uniref:ImmA/IrrE family metallo-endopeptidase n=1 Tax=Rhodopseudomonas palustris TaxID=1076 RepID=UPI001F3860A6|nr:ImmA/IrrE family metallo-endopeptidase [Rhodopseudomonas palustris]